MILKLLSTGLMLTSFDGNAGACSQALRELAPDEIEFSARIPDELEAEAGDTLAVRVIDDHRLLVVSQRSDLPELTINGKSAKFSWRDDDGFDVVVLEQCGLARSALALQAGSEYFEWTGAGFFESRPDTEVQASLLRTIPFSSEALGQDREIYLVIPEGWDGAAGDPLLISGDALAASPFGAIVVSLATTGQSRPVAFASTRFGEGMLNGAGVALRSAEYHLPGDSASETRRTAYAAHEKFFLDEFLPFVIQQLGGETGPIYTFGISSPASFALEQGLMRSDMIEGVIAASPPIHRRTRELASQVKSAPVIRLWCGTLEEIFCNPIRKLAEAHNYRLQTRHAAHVTALWEEALAASIIELFLPTAE